MCDQWFIIKDECLYKSFTRKCSTCFGKPTVLLSLRHILVSNQQLPNKQQRKQPQNKSSKHELDIQKKVLLYLITHLKIRIMLKDVNKYLLHVTNHKS